MAKKRFEHPSDEDFLLEIKTRASKLTNCACSQSAIIKSGQRTYKVASVLQFRNPVSGQISHKVAHFSDYPFRRDTGIQWDVKDRLSHWSCKDDEIDRVIAFLSAIDETSTPKDYTVVEGRPGPNASELFSLLRDFDVANLAGLISALADRAKDLQELPDLGESDHRRMVASALRASHRATALDELRQLMQSQAEERFFQRLFDKNWWMLGAQYVELIPKQQWTDEENLDMMLKTADGGYDIIELKRSNANLFKQHRGKWIVSSEVNDAVNQAAGYISEIDRQRDHFIARYDTDLYKVRAKVLIGTIDNAEEDAKDKRLALRMYNSHLQNIEVLTFDGITRICEQIINANLGESTHSAPPEEEGGQTPF
ncbi:Shedu anti-phage system protein SduA domain-containing protein [Maioricimonas sp. JC845]|uniref:Shedu anti-phage system protein SduA domain-containing protein n=1 Tax=Maioricimonas sp. JC845 TaxID=3232138 RepID=UPI00345A6410